MPNVLVGAVVFLGAPLFMIYKFGEKYAELESMSSQEIKPKWKAHKREMVRVVWDWSYSEVKNMSLELVGKSKKD